MRMIKLLLLLSALLLTGFAQAGQISPGLEAQMAERSADNQYKALLILDDQVDIVGLDIDMHFSQTTLASRHFQVVTALQEKAQDTQGALLADLEARKNAGEIEGYTSYWLINAVMVRGQEDAIRALAGRQDVTLAEVDLVPELIEPRKIESVKSRDRGIGISPGIVAVGARRVWDELGIRGEGALIGSLDTGVMGNHEALAERWRGNFAPHEECWLDVLNNGSTTPVDNHGHGTHTTGTMTGLADDDSVGVSPGSLWIAANAIDQGGNDEFSNDILDCLEFFTDPDGDPSTLDDVPDVVQNSWGVNENFSGYVDCDSRWWAAIDACEAAGVVLCWSAGNEGPTAQSLRSPGDRATTLYNCFSVGSTQHYAPYAISSFSSRGPAGPNCGPAENRVKPEISAPGSDIYSSTNDGGYQGGWDGTSMAGPHVAGVVALMRSANPDVDVITIKQILMETAIDLGTPGEDNNYGHGFVDAFAAVQLVMGGLGYVEGTITAEDTGLAIAEAVVTVTGGYQTATTGADGFYRLTLPLDAAEINVAAYGFDNSSFNVTVIEDETITANAALTRQASATLSGRVFAPGTEFPGSTGVAGVSVQVTNAPVTAVTTDADGNYAFILPLGNDYALQANLPGQGALIQTVPLMADQQADLYLAPLSGDDFETGDFSSMPWVHGGNMPWTVESGETNGGVFAAKTGDIGHEASTDLELTVDAGGELSFWYRVSTEGGYDYLRFFVDGAQQDEWSGEVQWSQFTMNLSPGSHVLKWSYVKDYTWTEGDDCCWIDDVVLPGGGAPVPRFVVMPAADVSLDQGSQLGTTWLVMNQGTEDLTFTMDDNDNAITLPGTEQTLAARGYQLIDALYDATGLMLGEHSMRIDVATNEPDYTSGHIVWAGFTVTGEATPVADTPQAFALKGAVPNPFNPQTTIHYTLPASAQVDLRLYDVQGRLVRTLETGVKAAGANEARWNGRDDGGRSVPSGTYFARLRAGGSQTVKSMVLVR